MNQINPQIEQKSSPFSLPKSSANSLSSKKIKSFKYSSDKENSWFYIITFLFILIASGSIIYILISLNQLQQAPNRIPTSTVSSPVTTLVPVNDVETVQSVWENKEIKINNNVVWSFQLPNTFVEERSASLGTSTFIGKDLGAEYKVTFAFPLFNNYPGGEPESLDSWIKSELAFLAPDDVLEVKSESFNVNQSTDATLLLNMNEVTTDSGNARLFGTQKSLVLYIDKTRFRNYSKVTVVPNGEYNEEAVRAFMERLASTIEF